MLQDICFLSRQWSVRLSGAKTASSHPQAVKTGHRLTLDKPLSSFVFTFISFLSSFSPSLGLFSA